MKATLSTLVLYIYNKYIYEDWSLLTKLGRICIYPFWFIRLLIVTTFSPILVFGYYWENSETYALVQESKLKSMVMMEQMMEQMNNLKK